jgi:predicted nucleotidyltransferase
MRKSRLLGALISATKQKILGATLLEPEREWYLVELARHLRVRPSSLQRELKVLSDAGILQHRRDGNRAYFKADRNCPIFADLAHMLLKTVAVGEVLRARLERLRDRLDIALVYGSMADSSERSHSDIDLLVVGAVPLSELVPSLRAAEKELGRPINPTVYTRRDFAKRSKAGDHFTTSILEKEPLFIIGGRHELAKLTAERPS